MLWKDLPKKDRKHLREMGVTTLKGFKHCAAKQAEWRAKWKDMEPCWDCRRIAREFGLPLTPEAE